MAFNTEKPLVFGLHGMGEHDPGWSEELFDALDAAVAEYGYSAIQKELKAQKVKSVRDLIDFEEICYGGVFRALLTNWAENARDAMQRAQSIPELKKIERGVGWLEENGKPNQTFVWTHLLDVFFWLTSSYVRAKVKNQVAEAFSTRLAARRKKSKGKRVHLSVIAHSLGTAVAQQTLNDMYAGAWSGARWSPEDVQFDSYHALANVCELLNFGSASPYEGAVRPAAPGTSAVVYFNDYRHALDPFTRVRPFAPKNWPRELYDELGLRHIRGVDTHAIDHYVQHPSVHVRILRSWFSYSSISREEERAAQVAFPDLPLEDADEMLALVNQIGSLTERDFTLTPDLVDLLKGIATYRELVKQGGGA